MKRKMCIIYIVLICLILIGCKIGVIQNNQRSVDPTSRYKNLSFTQGETWISINSGIAIEFLSDSKVRFEGEQMTYTILDKEHMRFSAKEGEFFDALYFHNGDYLSLLFLHNLSSYTFINLEVANSVKSEAEGAVVKRGLDEEIQRLNSEVVDELIERRKKMFKYIKPFIGRWELMNNWSDKENYIDIINQQISSEIYVADIDFPAEMGFIFSSAPILTNNTFYKMPLVSGIRTLNPKESDTKKLIFENTYFVEDDQYIYLDFVPYEYTFKGDILELQKAINHPQYFIDVIALNGSVNIYNDLIRLRRISDSERLNKEEINKSKEEIDYNSGSQTKITEEPTKEHTKIKYDFTEDGVIKPESAEYMIKEIAERLVYALSQKDAETIGAMTHPQKGVRFTPYTHISLQEDLVFTQKDMKYFFEDQEEYLWGYYDGIGTEILLSPSQYYQEFIYSQNFIEAEQVGYNKVISSGNMLENQFEIYEKAIVVEYYFSGFNPDFAGLDWRSLRLVFQEYNGTWKLVGVINNQWTT